MSDQPYIGLRPFERNETDIFFGRETHSDELINRLGANHFLAVIGTSGCGKSSLVKTGLIAGLEAGYLAKAGTHWNIVEMRPGQQPFQALAEKLFAELKAVFPSSFTAQTVEEKLRQGSLSLHELLAQYPLPNAASLLIVCDQFEEIFRFQQQSQAEARNFVSLLLASSKPYPLANGQFSESVYVVITMRSDFLGDCAQFAGLAEAINQGLYLTPRLDAQQLRAAIEEPAFVFGGEVEPALVTQLLEDAQHSQDQLPLLQHVLMRLWDLSNDKKSLTVRPELVEGSEPDETVRPELVEGGTVKPSIVRQAHYERLNHERLNHERLNHEQLAIQSIVITLADYQATGGLNSSDDSPNALSRHADEIFESLNDKQKRIAEMLFRALTERGDAQRDTRRPQPLADIVALTGASFDEVVALIEEFRQAGRCFLMPPVNIKLDPDSVIDISHESLIRQWQTLQKWVADEAENAKTYQRLEDRALERQKGKTDFLQSPELEIYQQWWQEKTPTALWAKRYGDDFALAQVFLDASELTHRRMEKAKARQRRFAFVVLSGFSVLALSLAGLSYWQYTKAEQQAQRAETQQQLAVKQKDLAMAVISQFTYEIPEKLANIPQTGRLTADILEFNSQKLEEIYALNPDDKSAQRERGSNFLRVGNLYLNLLGNVNKALEYYQQGQKILEKIAQQDPNNSAAQRDWSVSLNKLGGIYLQLN